jgi:uncharacterized protein (TIGR00288 family)
MANSGETRVAVFMDFENIKRAVDEYFVNERVDIKRILDAIRLAADGRITIKRAYADWGVFRDYRSDLLDNSTEPVQAFSLTYKGKNGTDIRLAIDVMDVVLRQEDITHVALASGDSDFTPLVTKLREYGRTVIGVGVRSNTSTYLAKACDIFLYYDDMRAADGEGLPERAIPSTPSDPVRLLATALASMGNRTVFGSALKSQMRKTDPMFDEVQLGHNSFLEFLRANENIVDVHKPAIGDISVAPKGMLGDGRVLDANATGVSNYRHPGYTPYVPSGGIPYQAPPPLPEAPLTTAGHYEAYLREEKFRYVPCADRHEIMGVAYEIFMEAIKNGEEISLKEGKDRTHQWFEENKPAVPWDSVNSTMYHMFYTWCFFFDRRDEGDGRQLWDRPTSLQQDIRSPEELISKVERGIVRKLWERERDELEADALNDWLYDSDPVKIDYINDLIKSVSQNALTSGYATHGAYNR